MKASDFRKLWRFNSTHPTNLLVLLTLSRLFRRSMVYSEKSTKELWNLPERFSGCDHGHVIRPSEANAATGQRDQGPEGARSVSYTHLTLPTTPYV